MNLHALTLDRFHPTNGFNQVALDTGIGFSLFAKLFTNNGRREKGNGNKQGTTIRAHIVNWTEYNNITAI